MRRNEAPKNKEPYMFTTMRKMISDAGVTMTDEKWANLVDMITKAGLDPNKFDQRVLATKLEAMVRSGIRAGKMPSDGVTFTK